MNHWTLNNNIHISIILKGSCNVFLVAQNGKYLLVDTSTIRDSQKLIKQLTHQGVTEKNLTALILTHAHFDHTKNAALIKEKFHPKVIANAQDADYLRQGDNAPIKSSWAASRGLIDMGVRVIKKSLQYQPVEPDILVNDRFDLTPLGFNAYVMHTPGHTPGSMSVVVNNEIALVGDAMAGMFGSIFPLYATDKQAVVASWKKLLDSGCSLFLSGHGGVNRRERVESQYRAHSKNL